MDDMSSLDRAIHAGVRTAYSTCRAPGADQAAVTHHWRITVLRDRLASLGERSFGLRDCHLCRRRAVLTRCAVDVPDLFALFELRVRPAVLPGVGRTATARRPGRAPGWRSGIGLLGRAAGKPRSQGEGFRTPPNRPRDVSLQGSDLPPGLSTATATAWAARLVARTCSPSPGRSPSPALSMWPGRNISRSLNKIVKRQRESSGDSCDDREPRIREIIAPAGWRSP